MQSSTIYRLVVDTSAYAGNFERQSIAYATGLTGECGAGMRQAQVAKEDMQLHILHWWQQHSQLIADSSGVLRPANIHPTPGMFNHGYGQFFPCTEDGRSMALVDYRRCVEEYENKNIERLSCVVIGQNNWTQEAVDRETRDSQDCIAAARALVRVNEHPAYMSVAIVVDVLPPSEVIADFSKRMREYLEGCGVQVLDVVLETENMQKKISRVKSPGL